jgi:hypothetical protein
LAPQDANELSYELIALAVPQRYQDPADPTCGAAALGMALEFLSLTDGRSAPETGALIKDLDFSGLLYDTGTGVEELAYLARAYGYRGASPFHGWTLEKLAGELSAGRPAVVSLGLNGAGQPGHFVTVTGIAVDGSWVRYNDPVLGEQTISASEFMARWALQDNSGLTVQQSALAAASDPLLPWMGLLGAVSVLTVLARIYPLGKDLNRVLGTIRGVLGHPSRQGLGGKLEPVYEWKQVQDGTKVVKDTSKKIYEYSTRMVQNGWKTVTDYSKKIIEYSTRMVQNGVKTVKDYSKKIYEYGTRMVQNGWKTVKDTSKKIYEYGTRMVQNGWKTVKNYSKKIYEYGTRWVNKGWKKVSSWAKGIWGWFKKTKWVPKKVKEKFVKGWHYATKKVPKMVKETFVKGWHYATKKVPKMVKETFVKGWHYATKKVPNMIKETFKDGWHYATKTVPKMVKETFEDGWHYATKEVPKYVLKKVQVGWEEGKDVLMNAPANTPTQGPPPTPEPPGLTGTPSPESSGSSSPVPSETPSPPVTLETYVYPNPKLNNDKWDDLEYVEVNGEISVLGEGDGHKIVPNDINQGDIGDCYFIAAMAEIASQNPEIISNMISEKNNNYTIQFYQRQFFNLFGKLVPHEVTIDSSLPMKDGEYYFSKGADPNEVYPMVIEKALAAENGSYKAIIGGYGNRAMEMISGVPSETHKPEDITLDEISNFDEAGYAMTATTRTDLKIEVELFGKEVKIDIQNRLVDQEPLFTNLILFPDHVYFVVDTDTTYGTITVANPHLGDGGEHEEIELTLEEFQRGFNRLSTNPLTP